MTTQQDTLTQLNTARNELTAFIIQNTAQPGTQTWTDLQNVIQQRDKLTSQINSVLAAAFQPDTAAATAAVADLTKRTQQLTALQKTMQTMDQIITVTGTILQAGASVLNIATGLV